MQKGRMRYRMRYIVTDIDTATYTATYIVIDTATATATDTDRLRHRHRVHVPLCVLKVCVFAIVCLQVGCVSPFAWQPVFDTDQSACGIVCLEGVCVCYCVSSSRM